MTDNQINELRNIDDTDKKMNVVKLGAKNLRDLIAGRPFEAILPSEKMSFDWDNPVTVLFLDNSLTSSEILEAVSEGIANRERYTGNRK
tara:strand:+ start:2505 stop:2771 length:267 start_codon:yes stop_codon:yes gene_type:complete